MNTLNFLPRHSTFYSFCSSVPPYVCSPSTSSLHGVYSVRYAGHTLLLVLFLSRPPSLPYLAVSEYLPAFLSASPTKQSIPTLSSSLFQLFPVPPLYLLPLFPWLLLLPANILISTPTLSPQVQSVFFLGHLSLLSLLSVTPTSTFLPTHLFFSVNLRYVYFHFTSPLKLTPQCLLVYCSYLSTCLPYEYTCYGC